MNPAHGGSSRRDEAIAFSIITVAAFLTRLIPRSFSTYPFNNDGLTECGMANDILSSGHLAFISENAGSASHAGTLPALNVVIAFFAGELGVDAYECAQITSAVF